MAVPQIDVEEALRLLAEETKDDTGLESPKDIFADFKSIREMWEEAKHRELHGTVHEQAAQLGYVAASDSTTPLALLVTLGCVQVLV